MAYFSTFARFVLQRGANVSVGAFPGAAPSVRAGLSPCCWEKL